MIRAAYLRQDDLEEQEAIALLGLNLKAIWLWRTPCLLVARPLLPDEEKGVFVLLLSGQGPPSLSMKALAYVWNQASSEWLQ